MTLRFGKRRTAFGAALLTAAAACSGIVDTGIGSETNWVAGCTRDDQCARGRCVCGLCTDACGGGSACRGTAGAQICVGPGSNPFGSTCEGVWEKTPGVCLHACTTDLDCVGAYRCEDGACVPLPYKTAAPQTTAPLVQVPLGAPCIPLDESNPSFPGYGPTEINVYDHSEQCASAICLVVDFRGRASCTYGQPADPAHPGLADPAAQTCRTPSNLPVAVPVEPQLVSRRPDDAVYCSCRCDGPEGTGPFCACPSGFECAHLVDDTGNGHAELAGSYCIKAGTAVTNPVELDSGPACSMSTQNCGPPP
jgi:hypothetical protein